MTKSKSRKKEQKNHPWRVCPVGEHWVAPHPRRVPKGVTQVAGHCRLNRSGKDQIYSGELRKIAETYFEAVGEKPKSDNLGFKYLGNRYDVLIAGWTRYWNDVLKPDRALDPNLVKALIATESSFNKEARINAGKKAGYARGLMQLTDWALDIMKDEKGELKDHLIDLNQRDMADAVLNIAAGVRWLHRKRETASAKLKRKADWIEAAADYKSYLEQWQRNPKHKQMNKLIKYYKRLSE